MSVRRSSLVALLLSTALPLLAGPAAAASTAGPPSRGEGVHVPGLSCSGDTLHATAVVRGTRDVGPLRLALLARTRTGPWTETGRGARFTSTKPGRSTWTIDIAGLSPRLTSYRVDITAAGRTVSTPVVDSASCAPGTEVPEVPVAPLVPLTLAITAGGLLAARNRRGSRVPADERPRLAPAPRTR